MSSKEKKIVLIADWITNQGGAEQVVAAMHNLWPESPIYTSVYTPGSVPGLEGADIRTSWLGRLPAFLRRKHQFLLPFLPGAFARLDLSEFDIIISSSSAFAKCVGKTRKDQVHICYCHTPTRYLYNAREEYIQGYPLPWFVRPIKWVLPKLLDWLTDQDLKSVAGVDHFISNSDFVGKRIKQYYDRESTTIYPCTDTSAFSGLAEAPKSDYFLALGRFIPYKRFDLLVETFAVNGLPLKLAGTGPELDRCKALAQELGADNIEFLGFVPTENVPSLYAGARAFLFPAEEDFGLTPIEAMAAGTPVLAYGKGGATESVDENSGLFFADQTVDSLQGCLNTFLTHEQKMCSIKIKKRAAEFSTEVFQKQLGYFVEKQ